jgi:hypothetical protein
MLLAAVRGRVFMIAKTFSKGTRIVNIFVVITETLRKRFISLKHI